MDGVKVGNPENISEPIQGKVGNGDDMRLNLLLDAIGLLNG